MRQHRAAIDVDLVTNGHIVTEDGNVLQTSPLADSAVPADNSRLDPSVVLDTAVLEQDAALQTHAVADDNVGSNGDVGANAAVLANLGRGVNQDVAAIDIGLRRWGKQLGVLARERREVQAGAGQEVLGLTNVHPETLEIERVEQAVLDNGRESLLLDRCGAELNALEDAGVENVDTGVDAVADELDRLLDEAVNLGGVARLVHNDTVLGRLLDLGHDNGALVAVVLVEFSELLEGVVAGDIGVEDEEGRVVLSEDVLGELEGTGGAEGLGLDGECDADVVLLLVLSSWLVE